MAAFDLKRSLERARARLGEEEPRSGRSPRSDRGRCRLAPEVLAVVRRALEGPERPPMRELLARIRRDCAKAGRRPPSRATIYKLMATLRGPSRRVRDLPEPVRVALYNLDPDSDVPEHQIAFYCFNYGDVAAMSFAAGLPWLALYQALRMPGYRERSRGPLEGVARVRRI